MATFCNNYRLPKPCWFEYGQLADKNGTREGFILFFDNKTEAMRTADCWRNGYPNAGIQELNTFVKTGHHGVFIPATCFPEMGAV